MLKNYIKIAFRNLWKKKIYALINVFGLALGIVCSLVIYVFIKYELSFDSMHSQSNDIYRVVEQYKTAYGLNYYNTTAYPLAEALRNDFPDLQVTQAAGPQLFIVSIGNNKGELRRFQEDKVLFVDSNYLNIFDFNKDNRNNLWIAGNARTAFQKPDAVVLTKRLAERYFPEAESEDDLIGKVITLNDDLDLTVSGVIRNPPGNTSLLFNMLVNYETFKRSNSFYATNWSGNYEGTTFLKLSENVDPQYIENLFPAFKKKYLKPEDSEKINWSLQPLKDVHKETPYGSPPGYDSYVIKDSTLFSLAGLAVFMILIASFNFINLTTAQAAKRNKEVGIRKIVGGTRYQIVVQFMIEMLLITSIAVLLSLAELNNLLQYINQHLSIINIDLHIDKSIILFSFILILFLSLFAGLYPSLILSGYKPIAALKDKINERSKTRLSFRPGLIVLQFGIAFFLISSTIIITSQMNYFLHKDLGFNKDAIVTVPIPAKDMSALNIFREQLIQNPNIKNVSFASGTPMSLESHYGTNFRLPQEPLNRMRDAELKIVDTDYLALYNLKLIAGSWLRSSNLVQEGFNGFIVNETLVKMLGMKPRDAIGKDIVINEGQAPIIGVLKDFNNNPLQEGISPCVLFYWNIGFFAEAGIRLQTNSSNASALSGTLKFLENTWKENFPNGIYKYEFLDDSIRKNYLIEGLIQTIFQLFAAVAIFVSCLGLLGLVIFTAEQRTKEIGIRKVLGASVGGIVSLLSTDLFKLIVLAIVLASPFVWWAMHQWLQDFEYRIHISWRMFLAAGIIEIIIASITISFQAIKAAVANPVKSLRTE